ncbi:MAG: DNA-protecting protein DprA, partial [Solirubrobacterales bacterium]|nr:DNA-protecting protein DprA [Solirubrobacterales bacterium]
APPVLAVLGDAGVLGGRTVGIVGSRNASANGRRFAQTLAHDLAESGVAVVSGLARGIDAAAHIGALERGATVACIAGGLDLPYPPEHAELQSRIARAGAVLAEMPLGTGPLARHFPRRNRIIAGLSLGVVVVEAALRSGSLITARLALAAGRELFAVPGSPLDARCRGSNDLIRQGAHLVEEAADVLASLPDHHLREGVARLPLFARGSPAPELGEQPAIEFADPSARMRAEIASLLSATPTLVDDLIRRCQFSTPAVMSALLELELAGRVETLPGNRVALLSAGV